MAHRTMLNRAKGSQETSVEKEGALFVCPDCKKEYKTKGRFEKHLKTHK